MGERVKWKHYGWLECLCCCLRVFIHLISNNDSVPLCLRKGRPSEHDPVGTHCLCSYIRRRCRGSWNTDKETDAQTRLSVPLDSLNQSSILPQSSPSLPPSLSPSIFPSVKLRERLKARKGWQDERRTQKSNCNTLFLIHLPSYAHQVICQTHLCWTLSRQERGVNEVCVCTRFGGACCDSLAPRSWSYGVRGLYLNLVVGPGT